MVDELGNQGHALAERTHQLLRNQLKHILYVQTEEKFITLENESGGIRVMQPELKIIV